MPDIKFYNPSSGRMVREDGSMINIADAISEPADSILGKKVDIKSYAPKSGRMIREDGSMINIADLIAEGKLPSGGGGESNITQVDHGTADTTFTLPSNQFHTWGEVSSLTLTLEEGASGVANAYWFSFDSGDTATTLSLPETVKTDIVVEPNMHYECSIVGGYMTFEEWEAGV